MNPSRFAAELRGLTEQEFRAFVAALWEGQGWTVLDADADALRVRAPSGTHERRLYLCSPDAGAVPVEFGADETLVVPHAVAEENGPGGSLPGLADVDPDSVIDASALRDRAVFAVDRETTRRLASRFFDADSETAFGEAARSFQSDTPSPSFAATPDTDADRAAGERRRAPEATEPASTGDRGDGWTRASTEPASLDGHEGRPADGAAPDSGVSGSTDSAVPGSIESGVSDSTDSAVSDSTDAPESTWDPAGRWAPGVVLAAAGVVVILVLAHLASTLVLDVYYDVLTDSEPWSIGRVVAEVADGAVRGVPWPLVAVLVGGVAATWPDRDPTRAGRSAAVGVGLAVTSIGVWLTLVAVGLGGEAVVGRPARALAGTVGAGLVAAGATAVTARVVGALFPGSTALRREPAPGAERLALALGCGLLGVFVVAGAVEYVGVRLALAVLGGSDLSFSHIGTTLLDWEAVYVEKETGGILVGLLAGGLWSRHRALRAALGAVLGYALPVGGAVLAATVIDPTYPPPIPNNGFGFGVGDAVVGALTVLSLAAITAVGTARLRRRLPEREHSGAAGAHGTAVLTADPALRTLALFCLLFVVVTAGVGLDLGRFLRGFASLGGPLSWLRSEIRVSAVGSAAVTALLYAVVKGRSSPRWVAWESMVGATAGYLLVANLWLLLFALSGPTAGAVTREAILLLSPVYPIPVVAGGVAALTAFLLRE